MASKTTTKTDELLKRIKNHPILSIVLVGGIGLIALGSLSDSIHKLLPWTNSSSGANQSPSGRSPDRAPITNQSSSGSNSPNVSVQGEGNLVAISNSGGFTDADRDNLEQIAILAKEGRWDVLIDAITTSPVLAPSDSLYRFVSDALVGNKNTSLCTALEEAARHCDPNSIQQAMLLSLRYKAGRKQEIVDEMVGCARHFKYRLDGLETVYGFYGTLVYSPASDYDRLLNESLGNSEQFRVPAISKLLAGFRMSRPTASTAIRTIVYMRDVALESIRWRDSALSGVYRCSPFLGLCTYSYLLYPDGAPLSEYAPDSPDARRATISTTYRDKHTVVPLQRADLLKEFADLVHADRIRLPTDRYGHPGDVPPAPSWAAWFNRNAAAVSWFLEVDVQNYDEQELWRMIDHDPDTTWIR